MNLLDFTAFYFSNKILCILRFVTFCPTKKSGDKSGFWDKSGE